MVKIPNKIRKILTFHPINGINELKMDDEMLRNEDFQPESILFDKKTNVINRTLTANMTGHITLPGDYFDLHFYKGSLKRISKNGSVILDKLNSRTFFNISGKNVVYLNESAFSFDSENEYGLRTLQIPKQKNYRGYRVITDFVFNRSSGNLCVFLTADYPDFDKRLVINERGLFEFALINNNKSGIKIIRDGSSDSATIVKPEDNRKMETSGKSFQILSEDYRLELSFRGENTPQTLAVKTGLVNNSRVLFINPGGSYIAAPAEIISGKQIDFFIEISLQ